MTQPPSSKAKETSCAIIFATSLLTRFDALEIDVFFFIQYRAIWQIALQTKGVFYGIQPSF